MNQEARMDYLIGALCQESETYRNMIVPKANPRRVLRSLMNLRMPGPVSTEFLKVQDDFLTEEASAKGIVLCSDIPTLKEQYGCIDNAIHSAAGIQLREECARIMQLQGHEEPAGHAKITKGYNLPAGYVIHTVGPIVYGSLTGENCRQLSDCYRSCLTLAESCHLKTIAFCCISTGEFHFPSEEAAQIAVETVSGFMKNSSIEGVIFNVFKDTDKKIYEHILTSYNP